MALSHQFSDGLQVVRLTRRGLEELFVTATLDEGEDPRGMLARAMVPIYEGNATVCRQDVFGLPAEGDGGEGAVFAACRNAGWPVTWLEGRATGRPRLVGTQLHAVAGVKVQRIHLSGRVVGSCYQDGVARTCHLGNLLPEDVTRTPAEQAEAMFAQLDEALREVDLSFADVIRTWLFLDDIHSWYGPFNQVRDGFFRRLGVYEGLVPASTGVGGVNPARAAVVGNALAIRAKQGIVRREAVPSPLQCPALQYGSSFSRAVEVEAPDHRRLYLSGTASIDPGGMTAHVGDIEKQIELTMRVVGAILGSRGMGWDNVSRAVAYVERATQASAFQAYRLGAGLAQLPVVIAESPLCRGDLLFEIELDALALA